MAAATRDPAAMGRLAESVIWPAIDLIGLVRGGGDHEAIGRHLLRLTDEQRWALPVVLAAMVDDEKTPDQLLGWITFDEWGRPLKSPRIVGPRWRVAVPCGTETSFQRHEVLREECTRCEDAHHKFRQHRDQLARERAA